MLLRPVPYILSVICVLLLAAPIAPAARAPVQPASTVPLPFGSVVQDAISAAGEEDSFAFSANAGDRVLARMSKSSGTLRPALRITDGEGTTLCSHNAPYDTAEIATCTLPITGTYAPFQV